MIAIIVIVVVVFLNLGNCNYTIDTHVNWRFVPNDICGTTKYDGHRSRIIGGKKSKVGEFPWLVRLGWNFLGFKYWNCGGTLITEKYVLTAGHCFYNDAVRVGPIDPGAECETSYCSEYQIRNVKKWVFNDYVKESMRYDIALILLDEPVQFTEFVKPACLPRKHLLYENLLGHHVDIAGWGYTDNNGNLPDSLMHINLPIIKKQTCELGYKKKLISSQLCIGKIGDSGQDSCNGDSGSGVTMKRALDGKTRHYLVGIVSHGFTQCATGPGIYTSVSHYVNKILDNITSLVISSFLNRLLMKDCDFCSCCDIKMRRSFGLLLVFLGLWTLCIAQTEYCMTPRQEGGDCKIITQCPSLFKILKNRPIRSEDADYLRKSQCGFEGTLPKVCCALQETVQTTTQRQVDYDTPKPADSPLLPSKEDCGIGSIPDKIYGGNTTDLDEFPWMALLDYEKDNGNHGFYCGGVLINSRYILTAAHCVKGKDLPRNWKLVGVRLGEYNLETDTDCVQTVSGQKCAPPPVNVAVEEQIAHEQYKPYDQNQYHDIALLRLARNVKITGFVRPICLPKTADDQSKNYTGKKLTVAGWGKTETRSESNIKLKLDVPVKANTECSRTYRQAGVQVNNGQLCAGGEKGKDSCRGDSGGPLMAYAADEEFQLNWFIIGVVSFGPSPCGMENWPGVYTKVANYVPWIVSKLRP
ncbi:serine protease easter [Diabrotica virgifera virgifera]|uniref:Serine protease easter-like n=1 Tax=Diabrotica virgifera virgifera TaxID=50390 RepID=A0ABM5K414_DIAVI|nr:serine protease easter [Diabrotica virgifera virgifera]